MEGYATEEQQVEALKSWWKSNGNAVIFGTVLGLAGLVGFRYYQDSSLASQEATSASYDKMSSQLTEQGIAAKADTQAFIDENSGNSYATLMALQFASTAVNAADYTEAETQLNWAISHTSEASIVPIAQLRLARVEAQQAKFTEALATLDKIILETFAARVAEVKGDIYLQQGDRDAARSAYDTAIASTDANIQLLQLKIDDLAVATVADDLDAEIAGDLDAQ